ncbi:MAG TPA: lysophospholipid acyltransferase family protein [Aggregatilineaceae bacterium]|nr:lysophospholipid acyltransferase family protein [Aggregatilineaceae bacterium]
MDATSSPTSFQGHPVTQHQERYNRIRRFIRDFLLRQIAFRFLVRVHLEGAANIPSSGPVIVIMNHIAGIDPFVVVGVVKNRFLVPMSKIENYQHPIIGIMARSWGAYPVRRGEIDRQALASTLDLLNQGYAVLIAPEGTRNPALIEAKDGMTYVALKTNATIVPIGLDGTHEFPGCFKRLRRAHVQVKIGRPFRLTSSNPKRTPRAEMHQMTREAMWQLASLLPANRRGSYSDLDQMTTTYLEFEP